MFNSLSSSAFLASRREKISYAFVCLLSIALSFWLFQRLSHHMDIYEKAILLSAPLTIAYMSHYFKAMRWYFPLVFALAGLAVYAYQGDIQRAQKVFFLKYFLSSQLGILWMSVAVGLASVSFLAYWFKPKKIFGKFALLSTWMAIIYGSVAMLVRWHESYLLGPDVGHIPISNLYEVFVLFILMSLLFFVYFIQKYPQSLVIGALFLPFMALSNAFLIWYATQRQAHQIQALVPALQSWWMKIHVPANFIGYATFSFAALLAVAYLLRTQKKPNHLTKRLPDAQTLNDMMYQAIAIGFAFFTLATILGAFWAAEAWGGYWSWDPKEVWALIVWLNYAAWLHARLISAWSGRVLAWWAIVGLFITSFAFMGVNLFLSGLHSYGNL